MQYTCKLSQPITVSEEGFIGKLIYNLLRTKNPSEATLNKFYKNSKEELERFLSVNIERTRESIDAYLKAFDLVNKHDIEISDLNYGHIAYDTWIKLADINIRVMTKWLSKDFTKNISYDLTVGGNKGIDKNTARRDKREIKVNDGWFAANASTEVKDKLKTLVDIEEKLIKKCMDAFNKASNSTDSDLRDNVCRNIAIIGDTWSGTKESEGVGEINVLLGGGNSSLVRRWCGALHQFIAVSRELNNRVKWYLKENTVTNDEIKLPKGVDTITALFKNRAKYKNEKMCMPDVNQADATVKDFIRLLMFFTSMSDESLGDKKKSTAEEYANRLNKLNLAHVDKISASELMKDDGYLAQSLGFDNYDDSDIGKLSVTIVGESPWMQQEVIDRFVRHANDINKLWKQVRSACKSKNEIKSTCCNAIVDCERGHVGDRLFSEHGLF